MRIVLSTLRSSKILHHVSITDFMRCAAVSGVLPASDFSGFVSGCELPALKKKKGGKELFKYEPILILILIRR